MNKQELISTYVNQVLNDLDYERMRTWLYNILSEEYNRYELEELEVEIISRYGENWISEKFGNPENTKNE
jgi:hypothetical protein